MILFPNFYREIARMLADDYGKRVMIVDTSNEIGGDGDIPHPGIGGARRLQVPNSDMQHKVCVMIAPGCQCSFYLCLIGKYWRLSYL